MTKKEFPIWLVVVLIVGAIFILPKLGLFVIVCTSNEPTTLEGYKTEICSWKFDGWSSFICDYTSGINVSFGGELIYHPNSLDIEFSNGTGSGILYLQIFDFPITGFKGSVDSPTNITLLNNCNDYILYYGKGFCSYDGTKIVYIHSQKAIGGLEISQYEQTLKDKYSSTFYTCQEPTCTPNWQIGNWSACVNGVQTRTAIDLNNCPSQFDLHLYDADGNEIFIPAGLTTTQTQTQNCTSGACTQDAKLCPDGSYVSRVAPLCEFAQCPVETCIIGQTCIASNGCNGTCAVTVVGVNPCVTSLKKCSDGTCKTECPISFWNKVWFEIFGIEITTLYLIVGIALIIGIIIWARRKK